MLNYSPAGAGRSTSAGTGRCLRISLAERDWRRVDVTTGKRWQDGASTAWVLLSYRTGESYAAALRDQSAPGRQGRRPRSAGACPDRAWPAVLYQSAGCPGRLAAGRRGGVGRGPAGRGVGQARFAGRGRRRGPAGRGGQADLGPGRLGRPGDRGLRQGEGRGSEVVVR